MPGGYPYKIGWWAALLVGLEISGCKDRATVPREEAPRHQSGLSTMDEQTAALRAVRTQSSSAGCWAPASMAPDLVVAQVKKVPAGKKWTFGNPPKVTVEVTDVLRGNHPKGKLTVVWGPGPNDIDTTDRKAELKAWKSSEIAVPAVGSRWIMFGRLYDDVLWTRADGRIAWSEENVARARTEIAFSEKAMEREENRRAEERRKWAEAIAKWRAGVKEADIERWAAAADFVGIGKAESDSFEVDEILKGEPRYRGYPKGRYFAGVNLKKEVAQLVQASRNAERGGDVRYLLFLSEHGMTVVPGATYECVGDGVIIADGAAVKAARKAVLARPHKRQITVAFCGYWPWELKKAVGRQTTDAVVIAVGYSGQGDAYSAKEVRKLVNDVDYVLSVEDASSVKRKMLRAKVAEVATGRTVLDEQWELGTEKAMVEKVKQLVERLVKENR